MVPLIWRVIAQQDSRICVIRRIGRRGLASACVEGILSSSSPCFAVIDADMQHDEAILPRMLERLKQDDLDIVIASRYTEGGSLKAWAWNQWRQIISQAATKAARLIVKAELTDPMSGFFVMRREAFDWSVRNLSQQGFKILLDLFASSPRPLRFAELPYHFRQREHGVGVVSRHAGSVGIWGCREPTRFLDGSSTPARFFWSDRSAWDIRSSCSPGDLLRGRACICGLADNWCGNCNDVKLHAQQSDHI